MSAMQVQGVVRLDDEMIKKLGEVARMLKPIGRPLTTSETIRACVDFAAEVLPHVMPLAARLASELGLNEPLGVAVDRIAASGVQAAHRQTDTEVEKLKRGKRRSD